MEHRRSSPRPTGRGAPQRRPPTATGVLAGPTTAPGSTATTQIPARRPRPCQGAAAPETAVSVCAEMIRSLPHPTTPRRHGRVPHRRRRLDRKTPREPPTPGATATTCTRPSAIHLAGSSHC
ncbi:hypothetical protein ILUMI_10910 [Ignelater luminosus]|uniref:Uncharacterized protein n=1 Tax=Ignelater luminosus TaxID=2038154 RepID=A0A8K0GDQ4_IGNLU|nr:hypothetical protein ILUMI_10910 [Ignelater luminosus]